MIPIDPLGNLLNSVGFHHSTDPLEFSNISIQEGMIPIHPLGNLLNSVESLYWPTISEEHTYTYQTKWNVIPCDSWSIHDACWSLNASLHLPINQTQRLELSGL